MVSYLVKHVITIFRIRDIIVEELAACGICVGVLANVWIAKNVSSSLIVVEEKIGKLGLSMSICSAQEDLLTWVCNFST